MEERKDLEVLWTVEQVAAYFSISKRTVYQWIAGKRMIDPTKLVHIGNLVRIPRSEVERIANAKRATIEKKPKPVAPKPAPVVEAAPTAPRLATPIK